MTNTSSNDLYSNKSKPKSPIDKPMLPPDLASTGYKFVHTRNGDPLTNLYRLVHQTAIDLATATTTPSEWPPLVVYLLRSLEAQSPNAAALESALDDICRLVTHRLNKGDW